MIIHSKLGHINLCPENMNTFNNMYSYNMKYSTHALLNPYIHRIKNTQINRPPKKISFLQKKIIVYGFRIL